MPPDVDVVVNIDRKAKMRKCIHPVMTCSQAPGEKGGGALNTSPVYHP